MGSAGKGSMAPLPAVVTLEYTWVHVCTSYCGNVLPKVKGTIDKYLGLCSILGVLDIDPYHGHVGVC